MNILSKHKSLFPEINQLFSYQQKVLSLLDNNQNTLSVIPTGGGKSLIFQLHALNLRGLTIVVSPLLALMQEQVKELNKRGIAAIALNSFLNFNEQKKLLGNLDLYKILYVSPERLQNTFFKAALIAGKIDISMLVIDEAHCISQWGSDFRPDYSQIPEFLSFLSKYNQKPIVYCLTATLSKKMRLDIVEEFDIPQSQIYIHDTLLRTNLSLSFHKVKSEKDKFSVLKNFFEKFNPNKTIAYLYSRKKCEEYSRLFDEYPTVFYHANVEKKIKDKTQDDFKEGKYKIMFATTAFGMGVNIIDIDAIVQIQPPHSIEEYYQQVGRGWRDIRTKNNCNCLAIWSDKNFKVNEENFKKKKLSIEKFDESYKSFLGSRKIKTVGEVFSIATEKLVNASLNLKLFQYKLQAKNIITPIAEINGSPSQIIFKKNTELWKKVIDSSETFDSFSFVSKQLAIPIESIFNHIFEQELSNNILKFPAGNRDFYFKVNYTEIPAVIKNEIITELNDLIKYNIERLHQLKDLFLSEDPYQFLKDAFD